MFQYDVDSEQEFQGADFEHIAILKHFFMEWECLKWAPTLRLQNRSAGVLCIALCDNNLHMPTIWQPVHRRILFFSTLSIERTKRLKKEQS